MDIRSQPYAGLASIIEVYCSHCDFTNSFKSSKEVQLPSNERKLGLFGINVRLIYGIRCVGKGLTAGRILCGVLNLPQPPSRFMLYYDILRSVTDVVATESMKRAIEETVEENKLMVEEEGKVELSLMLKAIPEICPPVSMELGSEEVSRV